MRIGIVGGGINGLCAAWQLALAGHDVSLFERGRLLGETSSSSSKLLHGGIRYLENFEFRLVKEAGVQCFEDTDVASIDEGGGLKLSDHSETFDRIINLAGPWAADLNCKSGIPSAYSLDLVRGSHLILERSCDNGYLLEVPGERRVFFVLPYDGKTLLGTTEVRQSLEDPIQCSDDEKQYLLKAYNHYFIHQADETDVVNAFAGIRPLIKSAKDPGRATREYAIERNGKVFTVFGGKWTTARALARKIVMEVNVGLY